MNIPCIELKQIGLQITEPALEYLSGINAQDEWDARGLSGHDMDHQALAELANRKAQAIAHLQQSDEGRQKIQAFADECREVMRAILLGHYDWLDQYMGDRHIMLICGLHRTGGSYLLDELSTIYDFPYQQYHCMHDDLPTFFPMLYWKSPHIYMQYIAEVAQFLVIVRRSVPLKVVVKKRAFWTFAMDSLANIFRNRLTVFLHVRHPIAWAWADTVMRDGKGADISVVPSMQQYIQIFDKPLKGDEAPVQVMMRFWRLFHRDSARRGVQMKVLPFGNYGTHIDDIAAIAKPGYRPAAFNPTARDYSKYAAYEAEANDIIGDVQSHWASIGLEFPDLKLL